MTMGCHGLDQQGDVNIYIYSNYRSRAKSRIILAIYLLYSTVSTVLINGTAPPSIH